MCLKKKSLTSFKLLLNNVIKYTSCASGNFGKLGHGNNEDQHTPLLVTSLKGHKVMKVACSSGDAQTVAIMETGMY